MKNLLAIAALSLLLLSQPSAHAGPVAYGSFSGTIIDFDDLAGTPGLGSGEALSNQYAGDGVTFNVPNFSAHATNGTLATTSSLASLPNVVWVDQGGGGGGSSAQGITINFATPTSAVGVLFLGSLSGTFTLAVYDGATLLESITSALSSNGSLREGYLALQNTNITRAVAYSTSSFGPNWNFSIDDLKFVAGSGVPEPASMFMLSAGLAALVAMRRKLN